MADTGHTQIHLRLSGRVQGIGLRPTLARLAQSLDLSGSVCNRGGVVDLTLQGPQSHIDTLLQQLKTFFPLGIQIETRETPAVTATITRTDPFRILDSEPLTTSGGLPPVDQAICQHCRNEFETPGTRLSGYPFIQCCDCGPRYTQISQLPYTRAHTSLVDFEPCSACQSNFNDSADRRYWTENLCCPQCGPHLRAFEHGQRVLAGKHKQAEIVTLAGQWLAEGRILAIKGVGGYHLLCDGNNRSAISRLRQLKRRPGKPLALLVKEVDDALNLAGLTRDFPGADRFVASLTSSERPITLLPLQSVHPMATANLLAPGCDEIGILLPYTALQHLLLSAFDQARRLLPSKEPSTPLFLVCTSANGSGEPLIYDETAAGAFEQLCQLSDVQLTHNRRILHPCDDSVVRPLAASPRIRPGRGFAPARLQLSGSGPSVLAIGAHLKNTLCLTRGSEAYLSPYLGNLSHPESVNRLRETTEYLLHCTGIRPQAIACDLHPEGAERLWAEQLSQQWGVPLIPVQHHHAHLASVLAEHPSLLGRPVLGLILDGFGWGLEGGAWGGELLRSAGPDVGRISHLAPLALPGGDKAIREIDRIGLTFALRNSLAPLPDFPALSDPFRQLVTHQPDYPWPETSSLGRWFDAAASVSDILHTVTYEGEAAIRLESLARLQAPTIELTNWVHQHPARLNNEGQLDLSSLVAALPQLNNPEERARAFQEGLIEGLQIWVCHHAEICQLHDIVLSGGCLANDSLSKILVERLSERGMMVYLNLQLPNNDSGISVGQAWVAMLKLMRSS